MNEENLINCFVCNNKVSTEALFCPKCGNPVSGKNISGGVDKIYAGFWLRLVAFVIDGIIIGFAGSFIQYFLVTFPSLMYIALILLGWLYASLMESSNFQATIGKIVMSLQVQDMNGKRISFLRATVRHFSSFISFLLFFAGYIMIGFTKKKQGLHDIIAGCLVVIKKIK